MADLSECAATSLPLQVLVRGGDLLISLPGTVSGNRTCERWAETLGTLGLKVATGPTVAFRNRAHLAGAAADRRVPLLWMQHVRRMQVTWPLCRRSEYLEANARTAWMLLHNEPMVIMRRFSPKEDVRRMTAAAYVGHLPSSFVGLENHLNYIHRPGGSMTAREVIGLAAVLNSAHADAYFRAVSGNTQINAADLRAMSLPDWERILDIADRLGDAVPSLEAIDSVVDDVLNADRTLAVAA